MPVKARPENLVPPIVQIRILEPYPRQGFRVGVDGRLE